MLHRPPWHRLFHFITLSQRKPHPTNTFLDLLCLCAFIYKCPPPPYPACFHLIEEGPSFLPTQSHSECERCEVNWGTLSSALPSSPLLSTLPLSLFALRCVSIFLECMCIVSNSVWMRKISLISDL